MGFLGQAIRASLIVRPPSLFYICIIYFRITAICPINISQHLFLYKNLNYEIAIIFALPRNREIEREEIVVYSCVEKLFETRSF